MEYPAPTGAPSYAPAPVKAPVNWWAVGAFVTSLGMLVAGLLTGFYVGSVLVLFMAWQGLRNAILLQRFGFGPRGRVLALIGFGLGIANVIIVVVLRTAAN